MLKVAGAMKQKKFWDTEDFAGGRHGRSGWTNEDRISSYNGSTSGFGPDGVGSIPSEIAKGAKDGSIQFNSK